MELGDKSLGSECFCGWSQRNSRDVGLEKVLKVDSPRQGAINSHVAISHIDNSISLKHTCVNINDYMMRRGEGECGYRMSCVGC